MVNICSVLYKINTNLGKSAAIKTRTFPTEITTEISIRFLLRQLGDR